MEEKWRLMKTYISPFTCFCPRVSCSRWGGHKKFVGVKKWKLLIASNRVSQGLPQRWLTNHCSLESGHFLRADYPGYCLAFSSVILRVAYFGKVSGITLPWLCLCTWRFFCFSGRFCLKYKAECTLPFRWYMYFNICIFFWTVRLLALYNCLILFRSCNFR